MGNPFITYSNRPSVGKIGASILTTLGHPEWIATSEEEYVEKAVALASDPQKLSTIRQNLRAEMEASHSWIRKVLFVNSKKLISHVGKMVFFLNGIIIAKKFVFVRYLGLVYHNIDPYARKDNITKVHLKKSLRLLSPSTIRVSLMMFYPDKNF